MFACSMCPFYSNVRDELIYHLLKRHRNAPNFIVHCSSDGCGASFKSYNSFRMHCIRNHCSDQLQKEITIFENDDLLEQDVETFDGDNESVDYEEKISDAQYLLKLKAGHNLSNTAIDEIVLSTKSLLSDRLEKVKKSLREVIPIEVLNDENMENILHVSLFDGLDSEYQQEKFFRENLGYVKPVAVKLGTVNKQVKRGGRKLFVRCDVIGYVVPFMEALQQLLKMPEVRHCLEEDIENSSKMRDFYDGSYMEKSFFQNHPDALLFCLYFDDFEIANPIGSHKKKHKLSVFYWSLINISPEFRFRIHATQLLAIAKTSYLKKFGLKSILSDFINSMQNLVTGVELEIGSDMKTVFGALYCVLGDTLAAQLIGGFKEGVGLAEKPCRTCEVTHLELSDSLHGSQFRLRDEQEHRDRCDLLDNLNKRQRKYWSRKYGITSTSVLLNVPVFDVTKCILHDPMHVLLEGIVKMEIQLMLSDFIEKCHFLTLKDLNVTIGNFEYTVDEALDKPHVLERRALDRKNVLPLTAIETKNFMTLLPFMIGEKIPEDNMKWQNFLRLVKITLLAISPVASAETVDSLHQIVYEHNSSFKKLYQDVDLTPKFHYLTHLADQINIFGPGRNHWCMRLEAKHGLIKNKKWRNFKCIEKSVAFYHQRWMCLQQSGNLGLASECYLYSGDAVKEGASLKQEEVADEICQALENFGVHIPSEILSTRCVCIKGISYKTGSTLLLDVGDEPVFGFIDEILVVEHQKFFVCLKLNIKDFNMHINAFECVKTNKKAIIRINDLAYKFPQVSHYYLGKLHVMLTNVDFVWN